MRNIACRVQWDSPNINEVTYSREDTGEIVKTRAMDESERQQELEFNSKLIELVPAAESTSNIADFFGGGSTDERVIPIEEDPEAVFSDADPASSTEAIKEEHDAAWDGVGEQPLKRGRGRPKKVAETMPVPDDESMPF